MRLATLGSLKLPSHSIRLMATMLQEEGRDAAHAFEAAGLTHALLRDPALEVTGLQELAFQRAFFELTREQPMLWSELGARYRLLSHAPECYYLMMITSPDMNVAVETGLRFGELYYTLTRGEGIHSGGRLVGIRQLATEVPADLRRFCALRDLGMNCAVFADLWGGPFPFERVELSLPASDDPFVRRCLPTAEITYGAEHSIWRWSVRLDERRSPQGDPALHAVYAQKCAALVEAAREPDDLLLRLGSLLAQARGRMSLGEAARHAGLSVRTLQRRLDERDVSFRDLAAVERFRAACRLLVETRMPIARIALEAGYENLSSFNHAFRRHARMSPRDYRRGNEAAA